MIQCYWNPETATENKKPRDEAYYLSAKPDIRHLYAIPGKTRGLSLIRNGSLLGPKSADKVSYIYRDTSRFDVASEILIRSFNNYPEFNFF